MIASLLVALQLATASPVLTVRGTGSTSEVPIARSAAGAAVRLDLLAPIVPLAIEDRGAGRYTITFAGVRFAVTDHAPFMEIGGRVVPLASAPYVVDGQLFLPLQAITEQLPRAAPTSCAMTRREASSDSSRRREPMRLSRPRRRVHAPPDPPRARRLERRTGRRASVRADASWWTPGTAGRTAG